MNERVTTNDFEVDADGLEAVLSPRNDMVEEQVEPVEGAVHRFSCVAGPFETYERTVSATPTESGGFHVHEEVRWALAIPLWSGLFRGLVGRQLRRSEAPERSTVDGVEEPAPWWSPPARLDARQTSIISRLCGLSMLTGYLGTTITQTMTYAAGEFGASKEAQGATLAAVRVGVLFSLVLMVISDRRGRHRLLRVCAVGGILMSAAGAFAPNLAVLGGTQTLARAFATALALLLAVVAAEEMPAGGRAYAASVLAMTAALGAGVAVILLPIVGVDHRPWGWRIIYFFPVLLLPFFVRVANRLPETKRFVRVHAKATMAGHRGRLLLLATASFLGLLFFAPISQFQNEFLRDEHGFSALRITIFTLATNTPGGIGIVIGGKLADLRGRRIVGSVGLVGGGALLAVGYQLSGAPLWIAWMTGTVVAAATVPALAVYGPELFPTALRGRANGLITLAGVSGSSVGLVLAGRFGTHFDRFGPGMAILAIGPLLVAILVMALYPETAHRELEELNPEDAITTGMIGPGL